METKKNYIPVLASISPTQAKPMIIIILLFVSILHQSNGKKSFKSICLFKAT